jgi:VIT1/CCC1 family predicted Fe2+/Mn2+ transporter
MPELTPEDRSTKDELPALQDANQVLTRRRARLRPHEGPTRGEQSATSGKSGTVRATIFGVNDGVVSNAALIMGLPEPIRAAES